jgi:hypothetical protein
MAGALRVLVMLAWHGLLKVIQQLERYSTGYDKVNSKETDSGFPR